MGPQMIDYLLSIDNLSIQLYFGKFLTIFISCKETSRNNYYDMLLYLVISLHQSFMYTYIYNNHSFVVFNKNQRVKRVEDKSIGICHDGDHNLSWQVINQVPQGCGIFGLSLS